MSEVGDLSDKEKANKYIWLIAHFIKAIQKVNNVYPSDFITPINMMPVRLYTLWNSVIVNVVWVFHPSLQQTSKQWNLLDKLHCAHPAVIHADQTNSTTIGITRDCLLPSPAIVTQLCSAKVSFHWVSLFPRGQMVVDGAAAVQIWGCAFYGQSSLNGHMVRITQDLNSSLEQKAF